jgi:hypothetical protein
MSQTGPDFPSPPPSPDPVLENIPQAESEGRKQFGNNFHFSPFPSVTAGFIGFSFDITKLYK